MAAASAPAAAATVNGNALPSSSASSMPRPRSPPKLPDLYGKHRLQAQLQSLNREISFLEVRFGAWIPAAIFFFCRLFSLFLFLLLFLLRKITLHLSSPSPSKKLAKLPPLAVYKHLPVMLPFNFLSEIFCSYLGCQFCY